MAFACNIDRRGRTLRTALGGLTLLVGIALLVASLLSASGPLPDDGAASATASDGESALRIGGIAACVGGAFMLFEGIMGWCAVRALGFKTPI